MQKLTPLILIASALAVFADAPASTPLVKILPAAPAKVTPAAAAAKKAEQAAAKTAEVKDPALKAMKKEQEQLAAENALATEREKKATAKLREELALLKLQKEHLAETLALEELKLKETQQKTLLKFEAEKIRLTQEALIAKARADKMANELKASQVEWQTETAKLEAEMKALDTDEKRDNYADAKPSYLMNPMEKDGTLVVSDRRIALNGPIGSRTADHVTTRINYYNNKDPKLPIFIVIDDSPGGSVMSGYRILKAMEGSTAPIYVVVKSFAASMAATITTLAERSYAYPNAVILHHQMSMTLFGRLNLTQQKELYAEAQKWWKRLASPIAAKMGISTDEFIKQMYEHSSRGDWSEFADRAQELKWVDHLVTRIHETSLVRNPDARPAARPATVIGLQEELDENGHPVMFLPRTNPRDFYFIYNPDGYYRLR
jgi:ATP-dependent Clp protease protease subunit